MDTNQLQALQEQVNELTKDKPELQFTVSEPSAEDAAWLAFIGGGSSEQKFDVNEPGLKGIGGLGLTAEQVIEYVSDRVNQDDRCIW